MERKLLGTSYRYGSILLLFLILSFSYSCNDDSDYGNNGGTNNPNPNEIILQGNTFSPSSKTISAGTTITWINRDSHNHTVTSGSNRTPDGRFDSGSFGANGTFSHRFDTAGTYNYYCGLHSGMTGTITVQ